MISPRGIEVAGGTSERAKASASALVERASCPPHGRDVRAKSGADPRGREQDGEKGEAELGDFIDVLHVRRQRLGGSGTRRSITKEPAKGLLRLEHREDVTGRVFEPGNGPRAGIASEDPSLVRL